MYVELELVVTMAHDSIAQPGSLPLLQYALTELFEQRAGQALTLTAYRALGGIQGILARRADELYLGLSEQQQAVARQLFLRLVTLGEGTEDTRRRVRREELESFVDERINETDETFAAINTVIDTFGEHRLLSFDRDPITRGPTVEVAHEALL